MQLDHRNESTPNQGLVRRFISWKMLAYIFPITITAVGVVLAIFALQDPEAEVTFETVGEANVFDVHRPLPELDIVFRDQNIREQDLNLRILTIVVSNSGEVDLLESHYESKDDWGIKFEGSKIIKANLVETNADHLETKVTEKLKSIDAVDAVDTVVFPKVILDKGNFFTIEVFLLHSKDALPSLSPIGKISGVEKIEVVERPLAQQQEGFFSQLFPGNTIVLFVRTVIYFFGSVLAAFALLLAALGLSMLSDKIKIRRRRNYVLNTQTIRQLREGPIKQYLVAQYSVRETEGLRDLRHTIQEAGKILWATPNMLHVRRDFQTDDTPLEGIVSNFELEWFIDRAVEELSRVGILTRGEDNEILIDPAFTEALDRLLAELGN